MKKRPRIIDIKNSFPYYWQKLSGLISEYQSTILKEDTRRIPAFGEVLFTEKLEAFERQSPDYDYYKFVLTDIRLTGMSGFVLYLYLKQMKIA